MSRPAEHSMSGHVKDESPAAPTNTFAQIAATLRALGAFVSRYGLVLVLFWIGAMKLTAYKAHGIQPLVAHSPLMAWLYGLLSVQGFSDGLGVMEMAMAVMIGMRCLSPRVSALGSLLAILMFLTTLSFVFSTPGWEPSSGRNLDHVRTARARATIQGVNNEPHHQHLDEAWYSSTGP